MSIGSLTEVEMMFTIRPVPSDSILGTSALVIVCDACRCLRKGPSKSSNSFSRSGPPGGPPELFTRMCTVPKPETTSSTDSMSSRSNSIALWPSPCISSIRESRSATVLAHAMTLAPALASIRAQERPIPLEEPQTRAVLPSRTPSAKGKSAPASPTPI